MAFAYGLGGSLGGWKKPETRKKGPMKLIISVVHVEDARGLVQALLESTVLSAVEDSQVPSVLQIIRRNCRARVEHLSPLPADDEPDDLYVPTSVEVGGATVFILDVGHFERF